jgi:hypothetical protein
MVARIPVEGYPCTMLNMELLFVYRIQSPRFGQERIIQSRTMHAHLIAYFSKKCVFEPFPHLLADVSDPCRISVAKLDP